MLVALTRLERALVGQRRPSMVASPRPLSKNRTFSPDRTLEDTGGVKGEDRKRAVDASRIGGSERSETKSGKTKRKGK